MKKEYAIFAGNIETGESPPRKSNTMQYDRTSRTSLRRAPVKTLKKKETLSRLLFLLLSYINSHQPEHLGAEKQHRVRIDLTWSARRDSNPRPPESESDALSNCATGGYSNFFRKKFLRGFQQVFNMPRLSGSLIIIPQYTCVVNSFLPFWYTIFQHHKALTISIFS